MVYMCTFYMFVHGKKRTCARIHTRMRVRTHSLTHPLTYSLTHTGFTIIFLYIHILYTMNNLDSFRELPT